ncbi:unnamed protein product [Microthlaspi erraticum]|uniref:CCHC-type domain-containing protein n=1 Tax=Microthlaspi erraticum TaxID=1685480 RepID=A0A6D2JUI8_9BRAS|nr:unnamed protein product [Microthlaspi erraticum]
MSNLVSRLSGKRWPYLNRWTEKSTSASVSASVVEGFVANPSHSANKEDKSVVATAPATKAATSQVEVDATEIDVLSPRNRDSTSECGKNGKSKVSNSAPLVRKPEPLGNHQSRLGAWAKPIKINSNSSLMDDTICVGGEVDSVISSPEAWPALTVHSLKKKGNVAASRKSFKDVTQAPQNSVGKEDNLRFPWAAKMNPSSRNLYRATEPEYLEDGTPKVMIPKHVLLKGLENQKEYILGQFYRCLPPPGGLIFAVFNKLWGRNCKITIRKLGECNYLFHIPDKETRNWVLQRGLWHVDDCLMFVASWTPEATLEIPEIKTMPVWVTLKKIPNILYSISGVSHIASGLGAPMATYKPRLDPILLGEAKILVEVELSKAFPPRIAASDDSGFISMVDVEYAWLPTKCSRCGELGHKIRRCLKSAQEEDNVASFVAPTSVPCSTQQTAPSVQAGTYETTAPSELVIPDSVNEPSPIDPSSDELSSLATVSILENMSAQKAPTIVLVNETIETPITESAQTTTTTTSIETPNVASAQITTVSDVTVAQEPSTVHDNRSKITEPDFGSNRFGSLISTEGDGDSMDSDNESDSSELMTPTGKRILRARPVKPSTKAKEMQVTARGRGNRGRGSRGGRG